MERRPSAGGTRSSTGPVACTWRDVDQSHPPVPHCARRGGRSVGARDHPDDAELTERRSPLRNREDVALGKKPPLAFHQPAVTAPGDRSLSAPSFPSAAGRLADRGFVEIESSSVSSSARVNPAGVVRR